MWVSDMGRLFQICSQSARVALFQNEMAVREGFCNPALLL